MNNLKYFIIIIFMLFITACGFKKGSLLKFPQEIQPLSVKINDQYGTLAKSLRTELRYSNTPYTFNLLQNRFTLNLQEHTITSRILTISTNTRIRQIRLEYVLNYSLTAPSGESLISSRTITIVRIHNENLDTLLGTHHDRQSIEEAMKKEAVFVLLNQLNSKEIKLALHKYFHPDYYEN